ncbi:MAG: glycosyltransferase [Candidatus Diapherotrites archaeon]|nr:glycosyltransferase [Candidatus Diapherotrites archaeon]
MKPKASVIIPAYNAEKTLGDCLASLRKQSIRGFETIVVDDGSTDETAAITKKFRNIKLLRQKNSGPAKARNWGAKKARGGIIVFTDSDCVAEKDFLKEMLKPFSEKAIAGVQGKYKSAQKEFFARLTQLEIEQRHEKMAAMDSIDFMGSYAAAYRKKVFQKMNGFDTSYPMASGEDTDLSFRISKAGHKMVFAPKAIVWHTHPSTWKKYFKVKFYRAFWRTKVYEKHKDKAIKDSYTSKAVKSQILFLCGIALGIIGHMLNFAGLEINPAIINYWLIGSVILFFASTLPFAAWTWSKSRITAVFSIIVALPKTFFFATGFFLGLVRKVRNSI